MNKKYEVQLYSDVNIEEVNWLWYPYIPFGKITLIQGDPGCGKSSFVMNLIADATRGRETYTFKETKKPIKVMMIPPTVITCTEFAIAFPTSSSSPAPKY